MYKKERISVIKILDLLVLTLKWSMKILFDI